MFGKRYNNRFKLLNIERLEQKQETHKNQHTHKNHLKNSGSLLLKKDKLKLFFKNLFKSLLKKSSIEVTLLPFLILSKWFFKSFPTKQLQLTQVQSEFDFYWLRVFVALAPLPIQKWRQTWNNMNLFTRSVMSSAWLLLNIK